MSKGFSSEQIAKLRAPLDPKDVKTRPGPDGRSVTYVDHWHVIEKANEIFGFDCWSAETILLDEVHRPQMLVPVAQLAQYEACGIDIHPLHERDAKPRVVACWRAQVRVTVFAGERTIIRTMSGAAKADASTLSEAVENASKAAETDALKRAFSTFCSQLGLALYDKEKRNVAAHPETARRPALDEGFGDRPPLASLSISERARVGGGRHRQLSEAEIEQHAVVRRQVPYRV